MYNHIHLEGSDIQITNVSTCKKFVDKLNSIEKFTDFFDLFRTNVTVKKNDCYELTYNPISELSDDEIVELIQNIIELCNQYKNILSLTIKIFDDGDFILYSIVKNNKYIDITDSINDAIKKEEKIAIKSRK